MAMPPQPVFPPHQQHQHARQLSRIHIGQAPYGSEMSMPAYTPHNQFFTPNPNAPPSAGPFTQNFQNQPQRMAHNPRQSMSMHRSRPSLSIGPGGIVVPNTAGSVTAFPSAVPPTPHAHFRQRRQPSICIGGPPKALLGGPKGKPTTPQPPAVVADVTPQGRKVVVKLPVEDARWVLSPEELKEFEESILPEMSSRNAFVIERGDEDEFAVTLPIRNAWEVYRTNLMEAKLAKLGVAPSDTPTPPPSPFHLHHPHLARLNHGRASSVSSPRTSLLARNTPSPLSIVVSPHPAPSLSGLGLAAPLSLNTPTTATLNAFAPSFTPSSGMVPRHGHSMSLAGPSFKSPNPFVGSFNPFGQGATLGGDSAGTASLSVSPQPPTSLASVSEYEEEEEEQEEPEEEEPQGRRRIYAPRPSRDRLDLHAPVLAASHTPEKRPTPPPPMTAVMSHSAPAVFVKTFPDVAPAKTLSTVDFMRGFGIEDDEEEEQQEEEEEHKPILDETQREKILAQEGPTPTAPRFPTATPEETESARIERAVHVDPAEDADEEDTQTEDEAEHSPDLRKEGDEGGEEGSHSRHVSIAPSLVEMGAPGRGFKDFKFGGREELREEEEHREEEREQLVSALPDSWGSFGGGNARAPAVDEESEGEWSNPSDEERAREQRRILLLQERSPPLPPQNLGHDHSSSILTAHTHTSSMRAYAAAGVFDPDRTLGGMFAHDHEGEDQDLTMHSGQSFVSNPSEDREDDVISNPSDDMSYGADPTFGGRPLPPLPHSRQTSAGGFMNPPASPLHDYHSPALTATPHVPGHRALLSATSTGNGNGNAKMDLNPLARPFVFGARPGSNSFSLQSPSTEPGSIKAGSPHSRQSSLVPKLNVAAPEFKPTGILGFVPTLPGPSELPHPLPQPPVEKKIRLEEEGTLPFAFPQRQEEVAPVDLKRIQSESALQKQSDLDVPKVQGHATMPASPLRPQLILTSPMPQPELTISQNTVPAGVFKALHESGTPRAPGRSRLGGSRDFFEHSPRRSLDDLNVPSIAKRAVARPAPVKTPEPAFIPAPPKSASSIPALTLGPPPRSKDRRSSTPQPRVAPLTPLHLAAPQPQPQPQTTLDIDQLESRLAQRVEDKLDRLRALMATKQNDSDALVKVAVGQLVASFRSHMSDYSNTHAGRGDAPAELDFDLLNEVVENGFQRVCNTLQTELAAGLEKAAPRPTAPLQVLNAIEDLRGAVVDGLNESTLAMIARVDNVDEHRLLMAQEERQLVVREIASLLLPHISVRQEPLDMDFMTRQLSEAVKPHISQLIDLASDKKETAALIVQHLSPVLHALVPQRLDFQAIAVQIAADLVRLTPQTDPHVIKEEVADLVVERLDARLALRDGAMAPEAMATRLAKVVAALPQIANAASIEEVEKSRLESAAMAERSDGLLAKYEDLSRKMDGLPTALTDAVGILNASQVTLSTATKGLAQLEELKNALESNVSLQAELAASRLANETLQTEKDALAKRVAESEAAYDLVVEERDSNKATAAAHATELHELEVKNKSLETSLAEALEMVTLTREGTQSDRRTIATLEQNLVETQENISELQNQLSSIESQAANATRELEHANEMQTRLLSEIDLLRSQQSQSEEIRRTAEKIEALTQLINATDSEDSAELRRIRDQNKALEREHALFQKRIADQDAKIATFQKTAATSKQSIAQAQQKSAEWERRALFAEDELDAARNQLQDAQETQRQLENEMSAIKDEAESNAREAQAAEAKDREQVLKNTIEAVQAQVTTLKAQMAEFTSSQLASTPSKPTVSSWAKNVVVPTARPGAANGVYKETREARPPSPRSNGTITPPAPGIWASIHAPKKPITPNSQPRYSKNLPYGRANAPSPTPSAISVAATEQEGGWWR